MSLRPVTADRHRRALEAMQPGAIYEAKEVAGAIGASVSAARSLLERMAQAGSVVRVQPVQRGLAVGWRRLPKAG